MLGVSEGCWEKERAFEWRLETDLWVLWKVRTGALHWPVPSQALPPPFPSAHTDNCQGGQAPGVMIHLERSPVSHKLGPRAAGLLVLQGACRLEHLGAWWSPGRADDNSQPQGPLQVWELCKETGTLRVNEPPKWLWLNYALVQKCRASELELN